jgi:hypothetical protein
MKELSLHILDIVQNSLQAGATEIIVEVSENIEENSYQIFISDNGKGMTNEEIKKVLDPFYTSKNKKTGLGIPLLKQHAELAGGFLKVESAKNKGVILTVCFQHNHLDRQPMGDIACTLAGILRANPKIHLIYKHVYKNKSFLFDTDEFKSELGDIPINSPEVINFTTEFIRDNINELTST